MGLLGDVGAVAEGWLRLEFAGLAVVGFDCLLVEGLRRGGGGGGGGLVGGVLAGGEEEEEEQEKERAGHARML